MGNTIICCRKAEEPTNDVVVHGGELEKIAESVEDIKFKSMQSNDLYGNNSIRVRSIVSPKK